MRLTPRRGECYYYWSSCCLLLGRSASPALHQGKPRLARFGFTTTSSFSELLQQRNGNDYHHNCRSILTSRFPTRAARAAGSCSSNRRVAMEGSSEPSGERTLPSAAATTTTTTQPPPPSPSLSLCAWTVCRSCRGEGHVVLQQQRRRKKKRQKNEDDNDGGGGTTGAAEEQRCIDGGTDGSDKDDSNNNGDYRSPAVTALWVPPPPRRRCRACSGTGIIPVKYGPRQRGVDILRREDSNDNGNGGDSAVFGRIGGAGRSWENLTVAVIGGGLAGLALKVALRHRGISCDVYERDPHFAFRHQGYGLTLQQSSRVLSNLGIFIEEERKGENWITSKRHVAHTSDGTILGTWGLRQWGRPANKKDKPPRRQNVHVARQHLRRTLLDAAGGDTAVMWGHRLVRYQRDAASPKNRCEGSDDGGGGRFVLTFQVTGDGLRDRVVERSADFLVGADGIRSVVREQLLGHNSNGLDQYPLRYLGCIVVLGICPLSEDGRRSSELLDGETVFQTADGTTRIYMMPYDASSYMWQLSFPVDENSASQLSRQGPSALLQAAIDRCATWHGPIPDVLRCTPVDLVSGYPVYDRAIMSPQDLSVDNCVTLIGDACHPMSPFKGQGANQALLDALALARCLYSGSNLEEFESEILSRSAVKVRASAAAARFLHSDVCLKEGNVTRGGAAAAAAAATEAAFDQQMHRSLT